MWQQTWALVGFFAVALNAQHLTARTEAIRSGLMYGCGSRALLSSRQNCKLGWARLARHGGVHGDPTHGICHILHRLYYWSTLSGMDAFCVSVPQHDRH